MYGVTGMMHCSTLIESLLNQQPLCVQAWPPDHKSSCLLCTVHNSSCSACRLSFLCLPFSSHACMSAAPHALQLQTKQSSLMPPGICAVQQLLGTLAQHLLTHPAYLSACSQTCVFCGDLSVWDGAEEMDDNDNEAMDLFENLNAAMAGK